MIDDALPATPPPLAVVIGATGGIGAALIAELRRRGGVDVVGLSRRGAPAVDVTDEASVAAATADIAARGEVRMVLVATGVLTVEGRRPERANGEMDAAVLARLFAVNAVGPALVLKHFAPLLPKAERSVFAALSARVGSIGDNRLGGWHGYRASKAALNQILRTAAVELRRTRPEAVVVGLHPGTVDTALSRPFARAGLEVQTPELAAARLLDVLDGLGPEDSGWVFDHLGARVPP